MTILLGVLLLGVLREKPVRITEKLSKAKPAIKKRGGMSGATLAVRGESLDSLVKFLA